MAKHHFSYFFHEGLSNMLCHGFMSFASIGTTVACLLIMGTFTLIVINADANLRERESENELVAFIDDAISREEGRTLQNQILAIPNITNITYVTREEAIEIFQEDHAEDPVFQELDPGILRDRYVIRIDDLHCISETKAAVEEIPGIAWVRAEETIAGGFITVRNISTAVCIILVAVLLFVSLFIISSTIRLTTFDRREEIAIMRMVGATNGFIRWPFVYEGLLIGIISAVIAFGLQWGLYRTVAQVVSTNDNLQLIEIIPFKNLWASVAKAFTSAGIFIGVGGSLSAIRKFLQV